MAGMEATNILPLNVATHRQWDRYEFALRPIAVPYDHDEESTGTNPPRSIYIQMVWLDDEHPTAVTTAATRQRDRHRPDEQGHFMGVQHGDVYKITTTDPARWPLPSFFLLQM